MNLNNYRNLPPRLLRDHRQIDEAPFLNSKTHRLPPRLLKLRRQQQTLQAEERLQTGGVISTDVKPFVAAAAATIGFPIPHNPVSQQEQHPWPPQLLFPPPQPYFYDQLFLEQHHPSQFLFSSAPFPPPHLYTPLPEDTRHFQGFFDGFFYTDSHITAAAAAAAAVPVPGYQLYQPQDSDESSIDVFVQAVVPAAVAHSNKPASADRVVCESYIGEEQQELKRKSQHKLQQQYDQDGKKIIGEGLAILNIVHGASYDELHVGSGSSLGGGIRVPGPFKVGEEEVVLPASLDEHDTSFIVIVPKN